MGRSRGTKSGSTSTKPGPRTTRAGQKIPGKANDMHINSGTGGNQLPRSWHNLENHYKYPCNNFKYIFLFKFHYISIDSFLVYIENMFYTINLY